MKPSALPYCGCVVVGSHVEGLPIHVRQYLLTFDDVNYVCCLTVSINIKWVINHCASYVDRESTASVVGVMLVGVPVWMMLMCSYLLNPPRLLGPASALGSSVLAIHRPNRVVLSYHRVGYRKGEVVPPGGYQAGS